jgi:hypothetical protein
LEIRYLLHATHLWAVQHGRPVLLASGSGPYASERPRPESGDVVIRYLRWLKSGVLAREDQTVASLEVPGHPAEDPPAFTEAVHAHLRRHLS